MRDAPWDLRDPRDPSELIIDAYVAGEATPEEIAAVEARCAENEGFKRVVEARQRGFEALPMANPDRILVGIEGRLRAREIERPLARPARARWILGWRGLSLVGAAAALLLYISRPTPPVAPPEDVIYAKGGVGLEVFRRRAHGAEALISGARVQAGDRLRFKARGVPEGGYALVVGMEASGQTFGYAPVGAEEAISVQALEPDGAFPGAAEVDDSKGREWAYLVWCPQPFALHGLPVEEGRLKIPEGCQSARFELSKP